MFLFHFGKLVLDNTGVDVHAPFKC